MAKAKITLIGFDNYMKSVNDDLFKNLSTPTGIDKALLVNNILLKGGEFEVLYAEPYFLQNMIGVWSAKWQRTMERWINALSIDYNPLENYDRMEDWTDDASRIANEAKSETASNNTSAFGLNSVDNSSTSINSNIHSDSEETKRNEQALAEDHSTSSGSGETVNTRSAFDSSTYSPHDKSETSSSGENSSTGITSADGTTETASNGISTEETSNSGSQNAMTQNAASGDESRESNANSIDNTSSTHSGRMHGNIGVTTSQQMLEAELNISKWNLYDEIADLFISEFCIYLY